MGKTASLFKRLRCRLFPTRKDTLDRGTPCLTPQSHEREIVRLPIDRQIDLHPFQPSEIPDVVEDYLAECLKAGLTEVRLIHGKGKGVQRARVRERLAQLSFVTDFGDAPLGAGGWGATIVTISKARRL